MPRLIRICLKRVLIDAIIVSVCVVFFVILRDLRVSEKNHPKTSSALAYLIGLAGWSDAWINCLAGSDSGAL